MQEKLISVTMHCRGGKKQHADEDGDQGATTLGKSKPKGQRNAAANEDAILGQWRPSLKKIILR